MASRVQIDDESQLRGSQGRSVAALPVLTSGEREQIERLRLRIRSTGRRLKEEQQAIMTNAENNDANLSALLALRDDAAERLADVLRDTFKV
jgi:hypothetical protein